MKRNPIARVVRAIRPKVRPSGKRYQRRPRNRKRGS
jgi:hypothetical protein